jgi:hypothetical protein
VARKDNMQNFGKETFKKMTIWKTENDRCTLNWTLQQLTSYDRITDLSPDYIHRQAFESQLVVITL